MDIGDYSTAEPLLQRALEITQHLGELVLYSLLFLISILLARKQSTEVYTHYPGAVVPHLPISPELANQVR